VSHTLSTKTIPARELKEGYTIVLSGSPQEIVSVSSQGDDIWVDIGEERVYLFAPQDPVIVVTSTDEF
jgi:hypothetical protein